MRASSRIPHAMDVHRVEPDDEAAERPRAHRHPRTLGRELALQYLYMHDVLEGKDVQLLSDFLGVQEPRPDAESADFARALVDAVVAHREELDAEIAAAATNWKLSRMAIVDRNILRLGLAELISQRETPYKVVINEAVELARLFSSEAACGFVNGLLDRLRAKLRPGEKPSDPALKSVPPPDAP
ncbi:MAG: transcription antitermination factor NusB [Planctomycetota bacterium]|nr:transcription antitermination factor NusB [Planctomycetota bacterium]